MNPDALVSTTKGEMTVMELVLATRRDWDAIEQRMIIDGRRDFEDEFWLTDHIEMMTVDEVWVLVELLADESDL